MFDALTPKQREVARLAAHGLTNEHIARELAITVGTVKIHLTQVYRRLGIPTRVQLILRAQELALR
jgi:DNA-binding NarL/FixJ family response regulator